MLVAKRADFEEPFNVPEDEGLASEGWIALFSGPRNVVGMVS